MSFRQTFVMTVVLALLGGVVFYHRTSQTKGPVKKRPDVWSFDETRIEHINLKLPEEHREISFVRKKENRWFIDASPGKPVSSNRWGGVVLLLSGPQASRVITENAVDLSLYGLNKPSMVISLRLGEPSENAIVMIGDCTPDNKAVYVGLKNRKAVYLIDRSWDEVMRRLVREPPEQIDKPGITTEEAI